MVSLDTENNRLMIKGQWNLNHGGKIVQQINELTKDLPPGDVVLDFRNLEYMDSSGISDMIQLNIRLRSEGRKIMIYQPSELIRTSLKLVKIDLVIPIID